MEKKILVLQFRPEDKASDNEFEEVILKIGNLNENQVHRVRLENGDMPDINLDNYAGVISCGWPYDSSKPIKDQTDNQIKSEKVYTKLLKEIIEKDKLFFWICYIGVLNKVCWWVVWKEKYSEDPWIVDIKLTEEWRKDKISNGIPDTFRAIVAHKEACQKVAENTIVLAKSDTCPFELLRTKNNIYAAQFHPDLDVEGLKFRLNIYKNYWYCSPDEVKDIVWKMEWEDVSYSLKVFSNFVDICKEQK